MSVKPIQKMNNAELDAELRRYGVDPKKLVDNFINKLAAVVRAQASQIAALEKLCLQQHEALEKSLWRPRAQFPSNPYCALCGVGRNWAIDHGHEKDCLIAVYAALFPKTGGEK